MTRSSLPNVARGTRAPATAWHAIRFASWTNPLERGTNESWTDVVLWSVVLASLLTWLLAVFGVLPAHTVDRRAPVISAAFAVTGMIRQVPGRPRL